MNCNNGLEILNREIVSCTRCPRLVRYRQEVADVKRRAYMDCDYWGKPVPSFGDPDARLLILGLAPGAHGSNRTGRMFTGDRSGEFLFRSLYKAGFASTPVADQLLDVWITAAAHCVPPGNKPLPEELLNCRPYFERELVLLKHVKVVVVLGRIALDTYLSTMKLRKSAFAFGHDVLYPELKPMLLCSYHPSQQNTSTGKLTQQMLDNLFLHAKDLVSGRGQAEPPVSLRS